LTVGKSHELPISHVRWPSCYRIIPSRFPPIDLFERVVDPADLEAVIAIESLTNERLRDQVGELRLVAAEDRISGPGSGYIMAALTHVSPVGSRFTDGSYGAYYAGRDLRTAIDETVYHREGFLRATGEGPMELDMRVLRARLEADLHDLRGLREAHADVYDPNDYSASQALGRRLREEQSWGVVYDSVRHTGGECVGVFRPRALSGCRQAQHLGYVWDGSAISTIYERKILRS
jgi:hypothetical protein